MKAIDNLKIRMKPITIWIISFWGDHTLADITTNLYRYSTSCMKWSGLSMTSAFIHNIKEVTQSKTILHHLT